VQLTDLVLPHDTPPLPRLAAGSPPDQAPVVIETAPGVQAEVVLHGTEPSQAVFDGVAVDPDGQLLLTTPAGIVRANLNVGALGWAVPVPGCQHQALPLGDGSVLVVCGGSVLKWDGDAVQIVAGGFTGGTSLLRGPGDEPWVFDYKGAGWLKAG